MAARKYISEQRDSAARETRRRILAVAEKQLTEGGYHAMTVASLADGAQVSPQTIYNSVGGKAAVVKALYDERLAGDDEPVPIAERPEIQRILQQPDAAAAVRAYVAAGRLLYERAGALLGALLQDGPGSDAELRSFVATIEEERRIGNTNLVRFIAERFGLPPGLAIEQAVDMVWALTAFELADRLVRRCGWSPSAYERWLGDLLVTSLCGSVRTG